MAKPITVTFEHLRDTKGAHRFVEIDNSVNADMVIGALYIRKDAVDWSDPTPSTLIVTITEG